jgi:hypothetical protein
MTEQTTLDFASPEAPEWTTWPTVETLNPGAEWCAHEATREELSRSGRSNVITCACGGRWRRWHS